ncbi:MAG TPA: ABC transporter substrate-binding protein [Clostridiaceae bacterium]|nr:ABC transporter substrate-binding protein [Clostridiaceae bacterium]
MKRFLVVILALVITVGLLAGCSGKQPSSKTDTGTSTPETDTSGSDKEPASEKKSLTLWYYWETIKHQETLDRVIKDFNSSQDKAEVTARYIPFADFKKVLSIGAAATELPDIVIIDSPDHAAYAAMGIFADLTDKLKDWDGLDQYYEGPINSCKLDGRLYGVPFGSNCLALFYNEDMLKEANCDVPTNWDELRDVAKKTTKDGVFGFAMCCLQNEEGTFNFMPWMWSTGTSSFEINNPNGIKALTFVKDLIEDGSMSKEVINWTQGDVMNQFISGNIAMMINGPWQVPTMREQAPDLNWNVALIPKDAQYASVLGGENFAVIKGDNEDAALEFVKFAADAEKLKSYIDDFGYIAARRDVAETQFTDDAIMKVFIDQLQYAQPRGPHERWPEISNAISLAVNEVITGASTPENAASKAQNTIDGIIGK